MSAKPALKFCIKTCFAVALTFAGVAPALVHAQSEQGAARRDSAAGNILPLRDIERAILPTMQGAQYLGPSYDNTKMIYTLKFVRDGKVIVLEVDARTAKVVRRSN